MLPPDENLSALITCFREVSSMADISMLLCDESIDMCFDDPEYAATCGGSDDADPISRTPHLPDTILNRVPVIPQESFDLMLLREGEYMPEQDYLSRLRSGELDISFRKNALDWISKAHAYHSFQPLSLCLSMNYLDRFLSLYELPRDKAWAVQLLAVACLSIAIKMEETYVPQTIQLQVGDPKFVFEAKAVQRMELLVLTTLNWYMSSLTPYSFVDFFLSKITDESHISTVMIDRSVHLILATIRGLHFLEFKPSEVAAAAAISVAGELHTISIDKVVASSSMLVDKDRVLKCVELIKDMNLMDMGRSGDERGGSSLPESRNGLLEAGCFGNVSDDVKLGLPATASSTFKSLQGQV